MRVAILGISHETNTFSIVPATYEEFEKVHILRGKRYSINLPIPNIRSQAIYRVLKNLDSISYLSCMP